jgi:hypothetical protein
MVKREEKHKKRAKNRGVWRSDNYQLQPSKKNQLYQSLQLPKDR